MTDKNSEVPEASTEASAFADPPEVNDLTQGSILDKL